jgi:hypothetical protein
MQMIETTVGATQLAQTRRDSVGFLTNDRAAF